MRTNRFLVQLGVWGLCLLALNVAVARLARNSVPRTLGRSIDRAPTATDLFLGNSMAQAGADPAAFAQGRPGWDLLNAGLGSSYPAEHAAVLHHALRRHEPERIYYGYVDFQLFDPSPNHWTDLAGSRALSLILEPELSRQLLTRPDDPLARATLRLVAAIPLVVERHALWAKVERLRRRLSEIGFAKAKTSRFGRADDFRMLEASDPEAFRAKCRSLVEGHLPFDRSARFLLDEAKASGAETTLVVMPVPADHRSRFYASPEWAGLVRAIRAEADRLGVRHVDASDWVADDGFADPVHLNPKGAAAFSRKLAEVMAERPEGR